MMIIMITDDDDAARQCRPPGSTWRHGQRRRHSPAHAARQRAHPGPAVPPPLRLRRRKWRRWAAGGPGTGRRPLLPAAHFFKLKFKHEQVLIEIDPMFDMIIMMDPMHLDARHFPNTPDSCYWDDPRSFERFSVHCIDESDF
jgi:hypothetical protein